MKRLALWAGTVAVAVAAALATTSGVMGVPAAPLGLFGLAAALLILLGANLGPRWLLAPALLALAAAGAQDFLRPGITYGHDIPHHAWALWSLWRCVLDGDWLPRWNPYLSLGIPLLQFYAPLPYLLAWPAQALGASPTQALAWLALLGQLGTAGSLFATTRWLGGSRAAASLAAVAAVLAPYHLMDQTFRLALGEMMALPYLAPFAAACWRIAVGSRDRAAPWVLGGTAAALLLTHLLSLIMASFVGLLLVALALRRSRRRRQALATLALTTAVTLGATAAWVLPVLVEMDATAVSSISRPGRAISPFAVTATEPIQRALWPRYDIRTRRDDLAEREQGMPMYFGCALLALALLAVARPATPHGRSGDPGAPDPAALCADPRLWGGVALLCLLLAVWPAARVLDGLPVLGRIMFPWRLYAPASMLAALAGGLALDAWMPDPRSRLAALALAAAALGVDSSPYLGAAARFERYEGLATFAGRRAVPVQGVPRDRWVRVEDLRLPPSDYDWQLALGRRAFPEYMAPALRRRYGLSSKPPSVQDSEFFSVSYRVKRGRAKPEELQPAPRVAHRAPGGDWVGVPDAHIDARPERVEITLPDDLPAGELRYSMAWFPGWFAAVDEGRSVAASRDQWLLSAKVPDRARRVEFTYSAWRPWDRGAGLVLSAITLLGVLGFAWRRPQRRAEQSPGTTIVPGPNSHKETS